MRNRIKSVSSIVLLVLLGGCVTADVSLKRGFKPTDVKRIGVLDFSVPVARGTESYGMMAADAFSAELLTLGFSVIERAQINKIMAEHHLGQSGAVDANTAKEIGRVMGVDAMVMGSIAPALVEGRILVPSRPVGRRARRTNGGPVVIEEPHVNMADVTISSKMIGVETGEILWVGSSQGHDVRGVVRSICHQLKKKMGF